MVAACSGSPAYKAPLTASGNIQLPPDTAGQPSIDLLRLDPKAGRLYVPHGSSGTLELIDLKTGKLIGSIHGLTEVLAVATTPDPGIVFTSNGDGTVAVVDVVAMKTLHRIQVSGSPDAIEYDPGRDQIVESLGSARELAFIDRSTLNVTTIGLPGVPELMALNSTSGTMFLAIHDLNEVVVLDLATRQITKTYKGCGIDSPTGLAYDPDQGRLFVADSLIGQLSILDVVLDKCLGSVDIGKGADQIAYNPHTHHVYTADGGSGYVSVVDSVTMKPVGVVGTAPGASTLAADPTTDKVYVAVKKSGFIAVFHDP